MGCDYCGAELNQERVDATGYTHCTEDECVRAWRRSRLQDFRLDLIPKVGFGISFKDDPTAREIGRSSGRTT